MCYSMDAVTYVLYYKTWLLSLVCVEKKEKKKKWLSDLFLIFFFKSKPRVYLVYVNKEKNRR